LEYHRERFIKELDKFDEELFTNGPLLFNQQRSAIERREELSFWQNYWYTAEDQ